MRHSFVIVFFFFFFFLIFFFHGNFRPDGSERDAPLYNGFLFHKNRERDSSTPYAPYPFYSSLPGNQTIPLQFTPQAAPLSFSQLPGYPEPSISQIPQPESSEKGEKIRRTSWEPIEVRSLIAAYRANYDRLKPTKNSHRKKNVWDSIMEDFVSSCSDAGIESEKTLVQIKEKWRSLCDKYKAEKDHKKCTKIYNARAQLLFRSLNLLFGDGNPNPSQPRAITHWVTSGRRRV